MTATQLLSRPARTRTDDPELVAHYISKAEHADAYVFGTEVTALCGYRWVPSRDPEGRPICPECQEIYESLP